jgi:hypothetical protein
MPVVDTPFAWFEVLFEFAVLALAAFLVTWLITDVLDIGRSWYIAILTLMVLGLSVAYLGWADLSAADLVTSNAGWGALAGVIAAAVVFPLVRKLPSSPHAHGGRLGVQLLWEGGVYGIAEALLLATLPVLVIWQGVPDAAGEFGWQRLGWGTLAVAASLVIILVHHLGYTEFRAATGRKKLAGALFSCGIQALAFLLTGSVLAPVIAHILLHTQMIFRGVEMPPAAETPAAEPSRPEVRGPEKVSVSVR